MRRLCRSLVAFALFQLGMHLPFLRAIAAILEISPQKHVFQDSPKVNANLVHFLKYFHQLASNRPDWIVIHVSADGHTTRVIAGDAP